MNERDLPPGLAAGLAGQAPPQAPILTLTEKAGLMAVLAMRRPDGASCIEFHFVNGTGVRVVIGDWGSWQAFRKAVDGLSWDQNGAGDG